MRPVAAAADAALASLPARPIRRNAVPPFQAYHPAAHPRGSDDDSEIIHFEVVRRDSQSGDSDSGLDNKNVPRHSAPSPALPQGRSESIRVEFNDLRESKGPERDDDLVIGLPVNRDGAEPPGSSVGPLAARAGKARLSDSKSSPTPQHWIGHAARRFGESALFTAIGSGVLAAAGGSAAAAASPAVLTACMSVLPALFAIRQLLQAEENRGRLLAAADLAALLWGVQVDFQAVAEGSGSAAVEMTTQLAVIGTWAMTRGAYGERQRIEFSDEEGFQAQLPKLYQTGLDVAHAALYGLFYYLNRSQAWPAAGVPGRVNDGEFFVAFAIIGALRFIHETGSSMCDLALTRACAALAGLEMRVLPPAPDGRSMSERGRDALSSLWQYLSGSPESVAGHIHFLAAPIGMFIDRESADPGTYAALKAIANSVPELAAWNMHRSPEDKVARSIGPYPMFERVDEATDDWIAGQAWQGVRGRMARIDGMDVTLLQCTSKHVLVEAHGPVPSFREMAVPKKGDFGAYVYSIPISHKVGEKFLKESGVSNSVRALDNNAYMLFDTWERPLRVTRNGPEISVSTMSKGSPQQLGDILKSLHQKWPGRFRLTSETIFDLESNAPSSIPITRLSITGRDLDFARACESKAFSLISPGEHARRQDQWKQWDLGDLRRKSVKVGNHSIGRMTDGWGRRAVTVGQETWRLTFEEYVARWGSADAPRQDRKQPAPRHSDGVRRADPPRSPARHVTRGDDVRIDIKSPSGKGLAKSNKTPEPDALELTPPKQAGDTYELEDAEADRA